MFVVILLLRPLCCDLQVKSGFTSEAIIFRWRNVARIVLEPLYGYQQSQKRVSDAVELSQAAPLASAAASTEAAPAACNGGGKARSCLVAEEEDGEHEDDIDRSLGGWVCTGTTSTIGTEGYGASSCSTLESSKATTNGSNKNNNNNKRQPPK